MAMTLRIEDEDLVALHEQADLEDRSMQQVVRLAIREYISRHRHEARVVEIGRRIVARDANLLRRLAE
jgi:predicted transcriptional regulator